jgi:hypothetical protein
MITYPKMTIVKWLTFLSAIFELVIITLILAIS